MRDGFLVIDKPAGITSHDVVAAVRAVTGVKKVGHTGTLDPFATGVLPLALGGATRLIRFLDESIKVYDATIQLGSATDTGDPTGQVIREAPVSLPSEAELLSVLARFVGPQMQTPPAYSAVKKAGKPLYAYAREGIEVEVEARPITIHSVELLEVSADQLRVLITCSRGTYARVLADDIATALGTAGHLSALCRRRSGPFFLESGFTMQGLADAVAEPEGQDWHEVLMARSRGDRRVKWRARDEVTGVLSPRVVRPIQALAHMPLVDVDAEGVRRVRAGMRPPGPPAQVQGPYLVVHGDDVVAVAEAGPGGPAVLLVVGE